MQRLITGSIIFIFLITMLFVMINHTTPKNDPDEIFLLPDEKAFLMVVDQIYTKYGKPESWGLLPNEVYEMKYYGTNKKVIIYRGKNGEWDAFSIPLKQPKPTLMQVEWALMMWEVYQERKKFYFDKRVVDPLTGKPIPLERK